MLLLLFDSGDDDGKLGDDWSDFASWPVGWTNAVVKELDDIMMASSTGIAEFVNLLESLVDRRHLL